MGKLENKIYFENGIVHTLTPTDINVIRKALSSVEVSEEEGDALEELRSLFLEYLD